MDHTFSYIWPADPPSGESVRFSLDDAALAFEHGSFFELDPKVSLLWPVAGDLRCPEMLHRAYRSPPRPDCDDDLEEPSDEEPKSEFPVDMSRVLLSGSKLHHFCWFHGTPLTVQCRRPAEIKATATNSEKAKKRCIMEYLKSRFVPFYDKLKKIAPIIIRVKEKSTAASPAWSAANDDLRRENAINEAILHCKESIRNKEATTGRGDDKQQFTLKMERTDAIGR